MGKVLDGFKNPKLVKDIIQKLHQFECGTITIMEVCGTHTMSILKSGLKDLLPSYIKLISGPGCPVCVTPQGYIDTAIEISRRKDVIITTFGDLIRVPGTNSSLQKEKSIGGDIRVIFSPLDSVLIAKENPEKEVVFLGIGFETTAPIIAMAIKNAKESGLKNYSVLNGLKTMPEAMKSLVLNDKIKIDGFICPGHVATIIGANEFRALSKDENIPLVIAGFETVDVVSAIYSLVKMEANNEVKLENLYNRLVKDKGNVRALEILYSVFVRSSSVWRGLGAVDGTGLALKEEYMEFDALIKLNTNLIETENPKGCICGDILRGMKEPSECKLYGKACTPVSPVGACMVSEEGTCATYYKYS